MSYIVLARKWRPRTFSQLIGQDHINKALTNSLNQNRLHHAYLFTGTRGVGKTSVARLFAKSLNCEQGISATPCLQCEACLAIEQGQFIDLIEIDGASKTRVEDTRELMDNVPYAPTSGRFKVYLIDEVHMLSQHSFNALLKTLEEPPSHVKFLLATTDPQKLPITVLSRCLQFHLKPIQPDVISQHLAHILVEEKHTYDHQSLDLLAKAARGSMRDALSLLDQAIACSGTHLQTDDVKQLLGYTQQDYALHLLQALAENNPEKLMRVSRQINAEGGHFHYVLDEMQNHLHQISLHQCLVGEASFFDTSPEMSALSTEMTPEDVQLFYQIILKSTEDMPLAPSLVIGFEMMLLRMYAFKPATMVPRPDAMSTPVSCDVQDSERMPDGDESASDEQSYPSTPSSVVAMPLHMDWQQIIPQLNLTGLALNAAENAEFAGKSDAGVALRIAKNHRSVFTGAVLTRIEQGLSAYYQEKIKLTLLIDETLSSSPAQQRQQQQAERQEHAVAALENDPSFQQMKGEFSAEIAKNSIVSLKDGL